MHLDSFDGRRPAANNKHKHSTRAGGLPKIARPLDVRRPCRFSGPSSGPRSPPRRSPRRHRGYRVVNDGAPRRSRSPARNPRRRGALPPSPLPSTRPSLGPRMCRHCPGLLTFFSPSNNRMVSFRFANRPPSHHPTPDVRHATSAAQSPPFVALLHIPETGLLEQGMVWVDGMSDGSMARRV